MKRHEIVGLADTRQVLSVRRNPFTRSRSLGRPAVREIA